GRGLACFRLDARPLDREPVRAEPEVAHQRDVVGVAVVAVAAVAGRIGARRAGPVLELPPVVVPVAAFDLVRGTGDTPQEVVRKGRSHGRGGYRVRRKWPRWRRNGVVHF